MKLLDVAIDNTNKYMEKMPKALRKKYGQFFTGKETAVFMAELFDIPKDKVTLKILDAGAGSGILSIALIERLQKYSHIKQVDLICYENDTHIIDLLEKNLAYIKNNISIDFSYTIRKENYILSQESEYNVNSDTNHSPEKYDYVIGNPPYMKVSKDAPEAKAMSDVCYGAPNLYFLFASMGLFNLKHNGEMVYIIPRSWTSGAYFKKFRQKFLSECALMHIHLFVSRDRVFESDSVLQETMIIKVIKTHEKPKDITVTTSRTSIDFTQKTTFTVPYTSVVTGKNYYVYLVTNEKETETLKLLNKWNNTLPSVGLKMKTGLMVDFRNRDMLRNEAEEQAVPLFYSQHIQNGKVVFPIKREHEYIVTTQAGLLQANTNYLFVKRFTSKEERRRLQCGIYLARKNPQYTRISTQNKINFIAGTKALSDCIVHGLYVIFNSTLYDSYYRILNGSTQVNSTEINSMPMPPIEIIEAMGKDLIRNHDFSEITCDKILRSYL